MSRVISAIVGMIGALFGLTRRAHPRRWAPTFLTAAVAVLVAVFGAAPASAATAPGGQTRVGASTSAGQVAVGLSASISAGQRLGNAPPRAQIVVATGVAAETVSTIDSSAVRFSQSSVKGAFSDGRSIDGLADSLRSGAVTPTDVPAIRLVEQDGNLFSLDNRRLLAFQKAGMGVPYRMATPSEAPDAAQQAQWGLP